MSIASCETDLPHRMGKSNVELGVTPRSHISHLIGEWAREELPTKFRSLNLSSPAGDPDATYRFNLRPIGPIFSLDRDPTVYLLKELTPTLNATENRSIRMAACCRSFAVRRITHIERT